MENYFNLVSVKADLCRKKQQQTLKNIPFLFPCSASLQTLPFHPDRHRGNGWEGLVSRQQFVFATPSLSYFSSSGMGSGSSPSAESLLQSGSSMGCRKHLLQSLENILYLLLLWPWCQQSFFLPLTLSSPYTLCGIFTLFTYTFPKMSPHWLLGPVMFCGGVTESSWKWLCAAVALSC